MNQSTVLTQINSAINLLSALKGDISELPERQQRKLAGANHIADVIYRLEVAKAEIKNEEWPAAPVVAATDADLIGIIDA